MGRPQVSGSLRTGRRLGIVAALLASFAVACGPAEPPSAALEPSEEREGSFSRIRYADRGLTSLNDRCPVSGTPLNAAIEPVYVNGRPIGFC